MSGLQRGLVVAALLGTSLALSGCQTATPYQSVNDPAAQFGYSSEKLAPDRFRVHFSGNRFTSRDTVEKYLLYRAAELTRAQRYDGFYIVRQNTSRDVDINTMPMAYPGWAPTWNYYGTGAVWNTYDPYIGSPWPAEQVTTSTQYDASAVIQLYRGAPPSTTQPVFNANDVQARLGKDVARSES